MTEKEITELRKKLSDTEYLAKATSSIVDDMLDVMEMAIRLVKIEKDNSKN